MSEAALDAHAQPVAKPTVAVAGSARRIKVMHIIKTLGLGGAETNLLNLSHAFDPMRIETHVAYSYGGEIEPQFRQAGLRLFKYADALHRVKSFQSLGIILRLAAYIRRNRIDIVQTHNFNGHIWGLLAARLGGAKVVEHVHDFRYTPADELIRRHGLLDQYRYIRHFRKWPDRVVVLTRDNAEYVVTHGIANAERVVRIPNGIGRVEHEITGETVRERFGIARKRLVVLTGARMDPTKNVDLVLRIAARVAAAVPDVLFVLAGNGTHLEQYRETARQHGLEDHLSFVGFQPDMNALLSAADIFLLPSFLELHSIAILEALRMAVPVVISSGVGCNDEFIDHGVNGYLCDPFAEQPWIDALCALLTDCSLRARVGAAGHETCERRFSLADTAARFEQVYIEVAR